MSLKLQKMEWTARKRGPRARSEEQKPFDTLIIQAHNRENTGLVVAQEQVEEYMKRLESGARHHGLSISFGQLTEADEAGHWNVPFKVRDKRTRLTTTSDSPSKGTDKSNAA